LSLPFALLRAGVGWISYLKINTQKGALKKSMNTISISRRQFARLLGAGAAVAAVRPALSLAVTPATTPVTPPAAGATVVRLSSNENPYGPSAKALKSMTDAFGVACRYPDTQEEALVEALAKLNGVSREQILLGDGSLSSARSRSRGR
jgi:histidinol-phosphate aminotransferase